ncbi:MAG: S41 family peptidase [Phycisphaerales bacterium]|nr:S41 family peptidase [Phycisphaerales bacterium]
MLSRASRMSLLAGLSVSLALVAAAHAQTDWASAVWQAAYGGNEQGMLAQLDKFHPGDDARSQSLAGSIASLRANIGKREEARAEQMKTVEAEFDKALAEPASDESLSKALRSAVELQMLSIDKKARLADPRYVSLKARAAASARAAEDRGDLFTASELFSRLDTLYDISSEYRKDVRRQGTRLVMMRTYSPQHFWDLRNARRVAEGEKPLPPYNPMGDSWEEKLAGINRPMVMRALTRSATEHVDQVGLTAMLVGGLDALRTMLTTDGIPAAFPRVADEGARARMLDAIEAEKTRLTHPMRQTRYTDLDALLDHLDAANRETVQIAEEALLHEFANGAMAQLDDFSAIIWPDELASFNRSTQGTFVGVGIQIQLDDLARIKVVTPLEDTPAQHAGVRPGDLITRVNGKTTEGFSLDQAVNVITGPEGTRVNLTLEREVEGVKSEKEMDLTRRRIDVTSVKGWRKLGLGEGAWDWFVDPDAHIGYVRLTGFTDHTDDDFDRAIGQMRGAGLEGMILDLRFNPGGLMDQAVAVASRFIDLKPGNPYGGLVVSTHVQGDRVIQRETVEPGHATLSGIPIVVLVNEGSASASEIVSGALKDYAESGEVRGVLMGERTYGKGSVQNVWRLPGQGVEAALKLTTQYYRLPDQKSIHRRPGAEQWGVDPNLNVEMLPKQIADAFLLRQNADVVRTDDSGKVIATAADAPNPDDLLTKGLDLQLQHAVVLLQTQVRTVAQAQLDAPKPAREN